MTNYEFIKSLEGTRLGAALSILNFCRSKEYTKEEILTRLRLSLPCKNCKLNEKEGEYYYECEGDFCKDKLAKWLNSPVDNIIVLSKLPKEYPLQSKMEFEQGWNACISYILTQMLSSEEENIE